MSAKDYIQLSGIIISSKFSDVKTSAFCWMGHSTSLWSVLYAWSSSSRYWIIMSHYCNNQQLQYLSYDRKTSHLLILGPSTPLMHLHQGETLPNRCKHVSVLGPTLPVCFERATSRMVQRQQCSVGEPSEQEHYSLNCWVYLQESACCKLSRFGVQENLLFQGIRPGIYM